MTQSFRFNPKTSITQVHFVHSLDQIAINPESNQIAIIDENVVPYFPDFIRQKWRIWIPVQAGENLKSWESATQLLNRLSTELTLGPRPTFWGIGGGSVLDTVGFIASLWKRGSNLIFCPTTTLSAIDSSHGGKTALNFRNLKNVLGTFHFPKEVWICRNLLAKQRDDLRNDGWSEALKMALIDSSTLYQKLLKHYPLNHFDRWWSLIPDLVQAKYKVIQRDPWETDGHRMTLNLGHTIGHLLELSCGLSHGKAVAYGLRFAHEFSIEQGYLKKVLTLPDIPTREELASFIKKHPASLQNLASDKKSLSQNQIHFVFIIEPGQVKPIMIPITEVRDFWTKLCQE